MRPGSCLGETVYNVGKDAIGIQPKRQFVEPIMVKCETLFLYGAGTPANFRKYLRLTSKSFGNGERMVIRSCVKGCVIASEPAWRATLPIKGCSVSPFFA